MKKISKILAISALALTTIPTNVFAVSETANVKVSIPESLTLTLSADNLTFNLEDTDLHTDKLIVAAKTNAAAGYTISFNTNNDYNDLKHSNVLVEDKIASITEDKTEETFPKTAWAYSTDTEDYIFKKIPLAAENIFTTTEKGENTHDFTIGVRANNLAAGDYENELIFTAVANPEPEPIYLLMQDVATWKDTLEEEQQVQAKDTRDNKIYWVSKLKDGNIWMTQNLDYDLSVAENQTLTPATSNVTENRTVVPANTDLATFEIDINAIYYLDGGDTYYANGTTRTEGYSTLPANDTNRHYAQGDYYSWKAATAGQGTIDITTEQDINESICPAGWRLPASNSADANYSFGNLVKQYGYSGENQNQWSGVTDAALLASPLFFVRGGYVYFGSLDGQGGYGRYWSSRAHALSDRAYYLYFNSSYVDPSYYDARYLGLSVRCVAL